MQNKPFASSAERNKEAILDVLKQELVDQDIVLEYGSGTAQHLTHFAKAMPSIQWQPSDLSGQISGIKQWMSEAMCQNIRDPIELDLRTLVIPTSNITACYTANTFHIISWLAVKNAFELSAKLLGSGSKFLVYGPFSSNGQHNSHGNQEFDQQLRNNNSDSGIRDTSDLNTLAIQYEFSPAREIAMPANNRILVWVRK